MTNISWIDLVLRFIPEALIIILAGYAVARKTIVANQYILASLLLATIMFIVKLLPISTIFHMILSIIASIIILVAINKIKILLSILSTFVSFILTVLAEGLNVFLMSTLFNLDMEKIFNEASPLQKNLYGLPSLFIFAIIVIIYFIIANKKRENVTNK